MKKEYSFINFDVRFDSQYYNRTFVDTDKQNEYSEKQFLNLISKKIHHDIKDNNSGLNYYSLSVDESDGMSWMLESLLKNIKRNQNSFKFYCLYNNNSKFSISSIIDEKFILKKAKYYKLISTYNTKLKSYLTIIIGVILALIFTGLQQIIKINVPQNSSDIPNFINSSFLIIILISIIIIGSLIKIFFDNKILPNAEEASNRLDESLKQNETVNSKQFKNLIDSLLQKFSKELSYPFFIIIDKYENLDILSKFVVKKYLENYEGSFGAETWIISHNKLNKIDKPISNNSYFNSNNFFQLKPLEYYEKIELIELINLDKKYADFSSIKEVCEGQANGEIIVQNKQVILDCIKNNEKSKKSYNWLDLLYLFSLNTKPYSSFYSQIILRNSFTKKNVRNTLLKEILPNSSLTPTEIDIKINRLKEKIPVLLEFKKDNNEFFRIKKVSYEIFDRFPDSFDLSESEKIHLFWTLFIGDTFDNEVPQYTTARQLIFHILKVKNSFAELNNNNNFDQISSNLYNYTILAINQSIEVCYFSEIFPLIEYAIILSQIDNIKSNQTISKNLVKKIWQVYSILNKQELLMYINNYNTTLFKEIEKENQMDFLFFEFMDNNLFSSYENRMNIFYYGDESADSVRIYFRSLSAWLSFTLLPISSNFKHSKLFLSLKDSRKHIDNSQKTLDRINNYNDTNFLEFEFRTISLTIWSYALYYSDMNCDDKEFNRILDFTNNSIDTIKAINEKIEIKKNNLFSSNYFYSGLFSEILTVSIASISLIIKSNNFTNFDNELIIKINKILDLINDKLNINFGTINSLSDTIQKDFINSIDKLFNLSSLVWLRLDIKSLYYFISLKRVQYFSYFQEYLQTDIGQYIRYIDLPLNEQNFLGVISNIIISNSYDRIQSKSIHFIKAVQIANDNNFGLITRQEFAIFILQKFNTVEFSFEQYLNVLLNDDYLTKYLFKLNDNEFKTHVVQFNQNMKKIENTELKEKIDEVISERYKTIENIEIKKDIDDWFYYNKISENISKNKESDISSILSYWKGRENSWIYPTFLELLIDNGYVNKSENLVKDAINIIENTKVKHWNTYFFLAFSLTNVVTSNRDRQYIYEFLKNEIEKWENSLNPDNLIRMYHNLNRYDNNEKYTEKIKNLETEKFRIFHDSKIINLSKNSKYYQILIDYYNLLKWYGLKMDISHSEFKERLNIPSNEKIVYLDKWILNGSILPSFTKSIDFKQTLNSDFMQLTFHLFSVRNTNNKYISEQQKINQIIKKHLPILLNIIKNIEKLPKHFKTIFNDYLLREKNENIFIK